MSKSKQLTDEETKMLTAFDEWLSGGGPAALVIRESLEPVEGPDGVFFPATFAAELGNDPDRFRGGYNIDSFPDGTNVCLIDTVGSQGNRIEPIFSTADYAGLVPQISIKISDSKRISLLDAGHRSGDAIVRCSELKSHVDEAFKALLNGNAKPLAQIAPTSLVFGVWDSRGTQAKLPRLVSSTIRAFNVCRHTRHAQYNPAVNFKKEGLLDGIDASDDDLASKGFVSQPIGKQPGKPDPTHAGVQLSLSKEKPGSIRRDATLGLAALRRLTVLSPDGSIDGEETLTLRRYVLGLALIALTAEQDNYLRQGCNLVPASEGKDRTFQLVCSSGKRLPVMSKAEEADAIIQSNPQSAKPPVLNPPIIIQFARLAAEQFGLDPNRDLTKKALPDREVPFSKELAKKDIKGDTEKLKGEVVSVDADNKKFVVRIGKKGDQKEVEIQVSENTAYTKGKDDSTFDAMVVAGAKLDIEVANGVAIKVIGKK
ncbi:MAG: type I-U CRISPR-associated RAMP protein Csb1/Cas7u [Pirellulaceae bacterium]